MVLEEELSRTHRSCWFLFVRYFVATASVSRRRRRFKCGVNRRRRRRRRRCRRRRRRRRRRNLESGRAKEVNRVAAPVGAEVLRDLHLLQHCYDSMTWRSFALVGVVVVLASRSGVGTRRRRLGIPNHSLDDFH